MTEATTAGPLSPEQRDELAVANERAAKLLGAVKVATFNGWAIGSFAAVTLAFGLFSLTALVMGVGMGLVAWNEFRGRRLLRHFDPDGPQLLGRNQLGFMTLLVAYCAWSVYRTLTGPVPALEGLEDMVGSVGDLVTKLMVAVYGGVAAISVLVQGLNARYYFARARPLREYLAETPEWIVELQRSTAGL
ncbi:MAG: hypothetical protein ACE5HT_16280 [Gemmatimonadales bacterium]